MANHGRCIGCGKPGATARHHVLPQQAIKHHRPRLARGPDLARLLKDPRNLVPMHFDCHLGHENWAPRLTREKVPSAAWEFAAELGEWAVVALERAYPLVQDRRSA